VVLLRWDGEVREEHLAVDGANTNERVRQGLEGIKRLIGGGYIEIVHPHGLAHLGIEMPRATMVIDDEGALRPTPLLNRRASVLYRGSIFGDAVVMAEAMVPDDDGFEEPDLVGLEALTEPPGGWVQHLTDITSR
jgi:hypothetical protein